MSRPQEAVDDWLETIAKRLNGEKEAGAAPKSEDLTVRSFLEKFGKARRGYKVVGTVRQKLETYKLRTIPDFEFEYIDNVISVELDEDSEVSNSGTIVANPTVRVDSLPAAHNEPIGVAPDDPIQRATTIMRAEDFSQLPVMTTKTTVKGVISWRSIGKAHSEGQSPMYVRDCMEEAHTIDTNTTLVDAMDQIRAYEYVLVLEKDHTLTGIVTATDLGDEFKKLAHPFLLVGEIEHRLRNMVRGRFTVKEFSDAAKGKKEVKGPDDLTLGDYCRLLEAEKSWKKLEVNMDRKEFIKLLDEVRNIRNDIMHFSPDDFDPENLRQLKKLTRLLA